MVAPPQVSTFPGAKTEAFLSLGRLLAHGVSQFLEEIEYFRFSPFFDAPFGFWKFLEEVSMETEVSTTAANGFFLGVRLYRSGQLVPDLHIRQQQLPKLGSFSKSTH